MIKEQLKEFDNKFGSTIISVNNEKLQALLKNLRRAQKEFDSTRFMVLIVGPVKSGKSTLVNILARDYVSPTAYEECTARPCIIAKTTGKTLIRQYKSKGTSNDDKLKAFDAIIDNLRGIADEDEVMAWATWKDIPFNENNITNNLRINPLNINNQNFDSEPLITLLEVKGGNFINDEIVLIDMPGLDGYTVSYFESDTYKRMAERADFVIFVQSTSSVINDSSKQFLKHLYFGAEAKRPPMCLIHNIHESAHWHSEAERYQATQHQMNIGIDKISALIELKDDEEIRKESVNLGKVSDYIFKGENSFPQHQDQLSESFHFFEEYENKLYEYLSTKQRFIKEQNSIKGAKATSQNTYVELANIKEQINAKLKDINSFINVLNNIPSEIINYNNNYKSTSVLAEIREEVQLDINLKNWENKIIAAKQNFPIIAVPTMGYLKKETVYEELDKLADSLSRKSGASKGSTLHNNTIEKFRKHWEDQFSSLKRKIEEQLSTYNIVFEFPYFEPISFVPYINDVFKNNDNQGWAGKNTAFRDRINKQFMKFKSEITDGTRTNAFLESIPDAFIGMCKEYANKCIEKFKTVKDEYTNNELNGTLDIEKQKLQEDLDKINKMMSFIKENLLNQ